MIEKVTFEETTFLDPPARFEAGTPHIVGAVGLHAAVDWVEKLTLDAIHAHECALVVEARQLEGSAPAADHSALGVAHEECRVGSRVVVVQQLEKEREPALATGGRFAGEPPSTF